MNMSTLRRNRIRRAVAIALVASSVSLISSGSSAAGSPATPAMQAVSRLADLNLPEHAKAGTGIAGTFNPAALSAGWVSIALPDGRVLDAERQRVADDKTKGVKSWIGTFPELPGSIVVMTTHRGVTTGFVSYGTETWELMPGKAGGHVLYRVDDSKLPAAEPEVMFDSVVGDSTGSSSYDALSSGDASSGYVHDLLVVYTPAASAKYGQTTLESMIQNAVEAGNQAYANSSVNITLKLVGLQEIDYVESGDIQTSLNDLRGTTDGKMDSVHSLRNTVGADIVSLISLDTNACGIAGVLTNVSTSSAGNSFNVVKPSCFSQHSLAHEIGHNQGNKHDRANSSGSGAYPYSYGFRRCTSDGTGFRTVMSYSCSGASRVAWFSNPRVNYNGYATGIDYDSDPTNSADNARSMMNTAATVAAFRGASTTPTAPSEPAAPSSLSATATSSSSITVKWADNSSDESGFRLESSTNGVDFKEIATLGSGTISFTSSGLAPLTTYYFRVRAYNSSGNSGYSNVGSAKTQDVAPAEPSAVGANNNGDGSATVGWVDASSNETGFEITRETWNSKRSRWTSATVVGTVPSGVVSMVDLSGAGTFRYSVSAVNAGGASSKAGPAETTVTGGTSSGTGKGRKFR